MRPGPPEAQRKTGLIKEEIWAGGCYKKEVLHKTARRCAESGRGRCLQSGGYRCEKF